MITIPKSASPVLKAEAPPPEFLLMAQAVQSQFDATQGGQHLKSLEPGKWGTPAELYNQLRKDGLNEDDAREHMKKSIQKGNPDFTPEEIDKAILNQAGS